MREMTEEELHNLPDFKAIESACAQHAQGMKDVIGPDKPDRRDQEKLNEQFEAYAEWVKRHVADLAAIEHAGVHEVQEVGPSTGVPLPIVMICHNFLVGMWKSGFINGALFQKSRTEEITSIVIPDTLEGLT